MRRMEWRNLWMVGVPVLALALAGGGCGDDDGCTSECDTLSTSQCNGTTIQVCSQGADGCLVWVDSVDCAQSDQVCDDATGNVICSSDCVNQCPADGDSQCNGTAIEKCSALPNGCLDWSETSDCGNLSQVCEDYTGTAECLDECVNECTVADDTQCNGTVIETCSPGPDDCLDWVAGTDCGATFGGCDDSSGDAECTPSTGNWASCATAGVLTLGVPESPSQLPTGDTTNEGSGSCWDEDGADVIAVYTATSTDNLEFFWTNANVVTGTYLNFELWRNSCDPLVGVEEFCDNSSGSSAEYRVVDVSVGDVFYMKVIAESSGDDISSVTFEVSVPPPPPTGAVCSDAMDLDTLGVPHQEIGTFESADVTGGACDNTADNVAWYTFTPSVTGWYTIDATNADTATSAYSRIAVFETTSCSPLGAEVACQTATSKTINVNNIELDAGTTYTVMFYTDGSYYDMVDPTINIRTQAPPPVGSNCDTAIDLDAVTLPHQATGTFNTVGQTGGSCDSSADNLVYYTYTPAADGWYLIDFTNNGSATDNRLAVFVGTTCAPLGAQVVCDTFSSSTLSLDSLHMQGGVTYTIVAYTNSTTATMVDPLINIGAGTVPGAGTVCETAVDLSAVSLPHQETGNFVSTGVTGGSCDTYADNVAWFNYTPSATGWYSIAATNAGTVPSTYSRLAVFESSSCTPYGAQVVCETASSNSINVIDLYLDAGTAYTIMFYTDGSTYDMVDPTIDIQAQAPPPAGSMCAMAIDLDGVSLPHQVTGQFDYTGQPGGSCDTIADNVIWFTYTVTASNWYRIDGTNFGASSGNRLAVFEGSDCTPLGTEVVCGSSAAAAFAVDHIWLQSGTTYLISMYTSSSSATMVNPQIDISVSTPPPPGTACSAAFDLNSVTLPYQATGSFDTNGKVGGSCDSTADHVVWYNYTPSATGSYTIDAVNHDTATIAYSRIAVFETTACDPYGAEVECQTESSKTISVTGVQLTAGTTYLILFYTDGTSYDMVDPSINISL
jgi:hypothetical protein